jgi:hypothetical protein
MSTAPPAINARCADLNSAIVYCSASFSLFMQLSEAVLIAPEFVFCSSFVIFQF